MRFVHYCPRAMVDSGVTIAMWAWCRALADAGHEVTVLHAGHPHSERMHFGPIGDPAGRVHDVVVAHRGRHRQARHAVRLDRHLGRDDLLVLHEGWMVGNVVAARAAGRARVPYVVMPHGGYDRLWLRSLRRPHAPRRAAERSVLEGAAAVHLFFQSEAEDVSEIAPRAVPLVAPTGWEIPDDTWTGGGGYLSWLGRYDPEHKGLGVLLHALARCAPRERPCVVLRGYDYKGGLREVVSLVEQLGLGRWVEVGGIVAGEEKRRFLREADGFLLPSLWECHSIALLENLSLGVPSLVSSSARIAPMLAAHRAAVVVDATPEALAPALVAFGSCGAELGRRGRRLVQDELGWPRAVDRLTSGLGALDLM